MNRHRRLVTLKFCLCWLVQFFTHPSLALLRLEGSSKTSQVARPHTPTDKRKDAKSTTKSTGRNSSAVAAATAKTGPQRQSTPQPQHAPPAQSAVSTQSRSHRLMPSVTQFAQGQGQSSRWPDYRFRLPQFDSHCVIFLFLLFLSFARCRNNEWLLIQQ